MKTYIVYYIIKQNCHGYLKWMEVKAPNQKEAFREVKNIVKRTTDKHAFSTTCKQPIKNKYGLIFNDKIYTRYNEAFKTLW